VAKIFVFNGLEWKPPVVSKLLSTPTLRLNLSYEDDELKEMPQKQRATFDGKFKAAFDAAFDRVGKQRMKEIQEAVTWTEQRIKGKSDKREMEEVVATANRSLEQAFAAWQQEIAKLCEDCVAKAYQDSVSAMEKRLQRAKLKAVCKIVLIAGLVLTAAALAIAASVVSGGALAPLVLGALATGAGALYKAYKVYDSEWASSTNKIKEIRSDIAKLEDAIAAYKKAEKSYAGALDKAKAFKATLLAPVSDIEKHVGQLDKYVFEMQRAIQEQKAKLAELAAKAKDAKSPELEAAVRTCNANMDKAADQLKAIEACKLAAKEAKAAFEAQRVPDFGKLNGVVTKLAAATGPVSEVGSSLKTCYSALKKLGVAVPV
jgi:predicted  nucleic acid-binding Zn-ribbon protein